jgi:hypothetical protein
MGRRNTAEVLELRRTGPFAPPVSVLNWLNTLVVTDPIRNRLEPSAPSLGFRRVSLVHVPEFHWERWDRSQDLRWEELPPMREIEDLIDAQPHSDAALRQMEPLWECRAEPLADSRTEVVNERTCQDYDLRLTTSSVPDKEFFGGSEGGIFISGRLKAWLEEHAGEWLAFHRVYLVLAP